MAGLDLQVQQKLIDIAVKLSDKAQEGGGSKESQTNEWIKNFKRIYAELIKAVTETE